MTGTSEFGANPFVGPRAFDEGEADYFFGRDKEIAILAGQVMSRRASLFFAQSGAGKSSLLRAGLIPDLTEKRTVGRGRRKRFVQKMQVLPILQVGGVLPARLASQIDNVYVFNALLRLFPEAALEQLAGKSLVASLGEVLEGDGKGETGDGGTGVESLSTLLIFDQFEELFTHFPERSHEREGFFQQVNAALQAFPRLHVLFAMREDYIAHLTSYAILLPEQLRTRFRMERLRRPAALQAVSGPVDKAGRCFEPCVAEFLVDNLRGSQKEMEPPQDEAPSTEDGCPELPGGDYVEPVHLQIVCRELWAKLPSQQREIHHADVQAFGDVDEALMRFYDNTMVGVMEETEVSERELRTWFGEELITPARTRGLVFRDENDTAGLNNVAVDHLEDAWIIRKDMRGGDAWYELAHDRLVEPVLSANQRWQDAYYNPLYTAYQAYVAGGHTSELFLTDALLDEAKIWSESHADDITDDEWRFLEESDRQEQERLEAQKAREEQRRRELETAQKLAEAQRLRAEEGEAAASSLRKRLILATAALVFSLIAVVAAAWFGGEAANQRDNAGKALVTATVAQGEAEIAANNAISAAVTATIALGQAEIESRNAQISAVTATVAQGKAEIEAQNAVEAKATAEAQSRRARAGELAAHAKERITTQGYVDDVTLILARDAANETSAKDGYVTENASESLFQTINEAPPHLLDLPPTRHQGWVRSASFDGEGQRIVTASEDGTAKVWEADSGEEILTLSGHTGWVNSASFDGEGQRIVTASDDGTAKVWEADSGEEILTLLGHTDRVRSASFDGEGQRIITASDDGTAKIWEADSGDEILTLSGHTDTVRSASFDGEGQRIVTASDDGTAKVWEADSGDEILTLSGHTDRVWSASFDGEGQRIVTASDDSTAKVWEADSGDEILTLSGHTDRVWSASFDGEGQRIVTASEDGTAKVWDSSPEVWIKLADEKIQRNAKVMLEDERRQYGYD